VSDGTEVERIVKRCLVGVVIAPEARKAEAQGRPPVWDVAVYDDHDPGEPVGALVVWVPTSPVDEDGSHTSSPRSGPSVSRCKRCGALVVVESGP